MAVSRPHRSRHDPLHARVTGPSEEATAAGIYGVIVSSAVMAASHADSALAVCIAVVVTLVIYWGAERYARLVAERIHDGRRPTWHQVRRQLASGWEIVTASALPLLVLSALGAVGVRLNVAVFVALVVSTLLLSVAGWEMGRGSRMTALERLASASVAGAFGAAMILLKALLH